MFVNCSLESVASEHLELVKPDRVVLEIPPIAGNAPEAIENAVALLTSMHNRGFKLAFNHSVLNAAYLRWLPLASFIKIDLLLLKPALVELVIKVAQKKSSAQIGRRLLRRPRRSPQNDCGAHKNCAKVCCLCFQHPVQHRCSDDLAVLGLKT